MYMWLQSGLFEGLYPGINCYIAYTVHGVEIYGAGKLSLRSLYPDRSA